MTEIMVSVQPGMHGNAQQAQDDLANLFYRNMTFNPDFHASTPKDISMHEPTVNIPGPTAQPIVYSVSQHYNHSAHIAKPAPQKQAGQQTQRPSSEPPQTEFSPVEVILRNYGLDPNILTPSQLQLFRTADDAQKLRLLELWSICPPNKAEDIPALAWSSTSVDKEEQMARLRHERQQNTTMSLDGTLVQTVEGRWTQQIQATDSEPYIVSGYEELMRREYEQQATTDRLRDVYNHFGSAVRGCHYSRATDPVYRGAEYHAQQQKLYMASQYEACEQFRGVHAEVDAMDM